MPDHDSGFGAIIIFQETFLEATLAIRSPNRLLGVISLEHVSPLHLHGDDEVGCRIGVRLPRLAKFDVAGHLCSCRWITAKNKLREDVVMHVGAAWKKKTSFRDLKSCYHGH